MDELTKIADKVELAGNAVDVVLDWFDDYDVSMNVVDELVNVMETCLGSAAELREIAGEGC